MVYSVFVYLWEWSFIKPKPRYLLSIHCTLLKKKIGDSSIWHFLRHFEMFLKSLPVLKAIAVCYSHKREINNFNSVRFRRLRLVEFLFPSTQTHATKCAVCLRLRAFQWNWFPTPNLLQLHTNMIHTYEQLKNKWKSLDVWAAYNRIAIAQRIEYQLENFLHLSFAVSYKNTQYKWIEK